MTNPIRIDVDPLALKLPNCSIPRPGDIVVWYQNLMPYRGSVIGHKWDGRPIVRNHLGLTYELSSFDCIRIENPFTRVGPNWCYLPEKAKIVEPFPEEIEKFDELLNRRIPPSPTYMELINEIWNRGFEIYLVGGTVRDVLAGKTSKDIDFVTTMPLHQAFPLVKSMYNKPNNLENKALFNGHIRLGGTPYSGDPFIDLCVFKLHLPGTRDAVFTSDFVRDVGHRDFACNSVYYEPVNKVLIDPVGEGIKDAINRRLSLVIDTTSRNSYQIGQVIIRFFKFFARGFEPSEEGCSNFINEQITPCLSAMTGIQRIQYIRTQILSKYAEAEHEEKLDEFQSKFVEFGAEDPWNEFIEPLRQDILTK
jgi:hypothetical protein